MTDAIYPWADLHKDFVRVVDGRVRHLNDCIEFSRLGSAQLLYYGASVQYFALLHHRLAVEEVLRLADLDQAKSAVLNSLSSLDAHRGYRHAIDEWIVTALAHPQAGPLVRIGAQGGSEHSASLFPHGGLPIQIGLKTNPLD